jgi:Txe/YoeB family toxin of toxin-antitoxin system
VSLWPIRFFFPKQAQKDIAQLAPAQKTKLQLILQEVLAVNPYVGKPLQGKLSGLYSYRLNRKDRLVYEIFEDDGVVFVIRAKTHYGD